MINNKDKSLKRFLEFNEDKKVVVVQGLGFVGCVMSLVVADSFRNEYCVIGIDINENIVNNLNSGNLHIKSEDPEVLKLYNKALKKKNFFCTTNPEVFSFADFIIVDINLDVQKNKNFISKRSYNVDLTNFKKGIESIGKFCKEDVLVIVETTVPPGTCVKVVSKILKESLESRSLSNDKIKIGHSYERVMPGPNYVDSIKNFYRVYSGIDDNSKIATRNFLKSIINTDNYPLRQLSSTTATETAKVLENSFRAMNIAFIDEWTKFSENSGINLFEIINAIKDRPTHKNIMNPGFGVGGYCLTKDPLLASWASQTFFNGEMLEMSENAVVINDKMPINTLNKIKKYSKNNPIVGVLGISYLKDIGDLRNTPYEKIHDDLLKFSNELFICDPYFESFKGHKLMSIEDFTKLNIDTLLIGCPHEIFHKKNVIQKIFELNPDLIIVDPFNLDLNNKIKHHKIIGNGIN